MAQQPEDVVITCTLSARPQAGADPVEWAPEHIAHWLRENADRIAASAVEMMSASRGNRGGHFEMEGGVTHGPGGTTVTVTGKVVISF